MSEELIVRYCAPTLAGLKTGTIFNCKYHSDAALNGWLRSINRRLGKRGLRVLPLKKKNGRVMIYVYRPSKLKDDISQEKAVELLEMHGYVYKNPGNCIARLIERLATSEEFPHEIGLFLGYPHEDVRGFIETVRRDQSASARGRCTATRKRRKEPFRFIRNAPTFTSVTTKWARASKGLP